MKAKYLVRFDDFCPTMNWPVWNQLEMILEKHDIKPIIAIVPDNRDQKLAVGPPMLDFWARVRAWQAAGWFIAMHGYQHQYLTSDAGIMRINKFSEFSGLSYQEQRNKLAKGVAVFKEHGVRIDGWIAPAHSFDANTVKALLDLNINIISDGFYWRPVSKLGALWIPQQLWRFRKMSYGLWTVCLHHNEYSALSIKKFAQDIEDYAPAIISVDQVQRDFAIKECTLLDNLMVIFWHISLRSKEILWLIVNFIKKIIK